MMGGSTLAYATRTQQNRLVRFKKGLYIEGSYECPIPPVYKVANLPVKKAFINIENVVASATLHQNIDLNSIVRVFPGVEYRPEQFPGLVYRLKKPKTATLIFSSGKMVCTGAKSERQARKAVMKVVDELKRNGIVILGKPEIQIQNIVASAGLGGAIDLEKSTYSLKRTMYEPEQFPGLIYRMDDPKVVILLFASGKLVCTGAKKETEVHRAVAKLQGTLEEKVLIAYEAAPAPAATPSP
jgi:transcription initiation factor TFIID TATA-box-binding protein